jgi:uncharacterized membrane protein YphA (DoxX/SURF4 family)
MSHDVSQLGSSRRAALSDPAFQAFLLLRTAFTVAPIVFGLDKFAGLLVDWPRYLAPWIDRIVPGSAEQAMYAVGVVEVVAGITVALLPRFGSWHRHRVARRDHHQPADHPRLLRHRST